METADQTALSSKQIVHSFIKALNDEDFAMARTYLSEHMKFEGVLGSREGAEAYINDMKDMKLKYIIQKTFQDGNDVCLWYNIAMSGLNVFSAGWYHLEEGKIKSFKVIFDPRPLLEQ